MNSGSKLTFSLSFTLAVAVTRPAIAAIDNSGILNNVTDQFHSQAASWGGIILSAATRLFWLLGTISLVWTGAILVLKKADIGEFFAEFIRFIFFFGIFLWLLTNSVAIATSIINSLIQLGASASRTSATTPSGIMDIGFNIFDKVISQSTIWSPAKTVIGAVLAGIILIVVALIAANMTIMLCSAWILLYSGVFFLGFGGSRWTSDIAINYYKTILGVAVSLMAMILMVGIAQSIITDYYNRMSADMNIQEIATIMVVAIILLALINRVPGLISGILTGASHHSSGIGTFGTGAAVGATSVALAAAATSAAVASAAARNMGGTGQAIKAAYQNAQASNSSESSGLSAAMGNAKSFVAEIGKGAGKAIKQSAADTAQNFNTAASQTLPGRAAQVIKDSALPNSISKGGGTKPTSEAEEIDAFVNKKA